MLSKIGRYEVKNFIGRGGAGQVYKAVDPRVKREVAIKVLTADSYDQRVRFQREAEVLAKLEHPNIVPIYDFGEQDGKPYIVMRYISGGTLHHKIQNQPLKYSEILSIFQKVADALDFAHQQGIVHRDIKPANILFDDRDEPLIADFGLSKIFSTGPGVSPTLDKIIGTPHYMSPEQSSGKKLDHLTDIYSLGVILFEIFNGRVPFDAEDSIAIIYKHINEPAPEMSHLPSEVGEVIHKALAKEPSNRFQEATEMVKALSFAVESLSGESPKIQPKIIERTTAVITRKPIIPIVSLIIAILAIIGFFLIQRDNTAEPTPLAAVPTVAPSALPTEAAEPTETITPSPEPSPTIIPTSTLDEASTDLLAAASSLFVITREETKIYSGPGSEGFEDVGVAALRGDELTLLATNEEKTWVLIQLSTGRTGWVIATAGRIDGEQVDVALTEPAPVIIAEPTAPETPIPPTEEPEPTATNTLEPTVAPIIVLPSPTPLNPLDLDGDGVLHDPENGQYDLCQEAAGSADKCGCPEGQVPNSCGGGGGGNSGGLP